MLAPIVKTIEVPCSQEKAFTVFLNEMDSWWPLGKFTVSAYGGTPAQAIRVEAKQGGKIVEIGPSGTEYLWGTIISYDPYDFVSMDFHIAPPGDRKSTRLNSSHMSISYAVFCLKKKKTTKSTSP